MAVTLIYYPVCGTDGKEYSNEGEMQARACMNDKMVTVAKVGHCGKFPLLSSDHLEHINCIH